MSGQDFKKLERVRGDCRWTVEQQDQVVIKQFVLINYFQSLIKRRWEREHAALSVLKLRGVPAPTTFGYTSARHGTVAYRREFVPGISPAQLSDQQVEQLARLFSDIHAAGVTNGDAALDNLLVVPDGTLILIDYGRAHTSRFKGPVFRF